MRNHSWLVVALVGGVLLTGCTSGGVSGDANVDDSVDVDSQAPPSTDAEDPADAENPGEPEITLSVCSDGDRVGMQNTITAQTDAFTAGDFGLAYSYASPSFQEAVSLEDFEALISTSYGPLTASTDLRFGECVVDSDSGVGAIDARFSQAGVEVFGIRYVMNDTSEGWRVDGASNLEIVGNDA